MLEKAPHAVTAAVAADAARSDRSVERDVVYVYEAPVRLWRWINAAAILVLVLVAFFAGYAPRRKREGTIIAEASAQSMAIPTVNVTLAERSDANSAMVLPGNVQAIAEAPILARSDGYVKKRYADIGDRVRKGQVLAEIEAPELDQQVTQGAANLQQTEAALEQANANYQQGKANEQLAKVTATRWQHLASKGAVSLQENDQYQAQYQAQVANLTALEKAVAAARSNIAAMQANLARLKELQSYEKVTAPFSGVIGLRSVSVGDYVKEGADLVNLEAIDPLKVDFRVPETYLRQVQPGQSLTITLDALPGSTFDGKVVAIMGASPGPVGTARVQYDLRKVLVFMNTFTVNKPEVFIANCATKFDAQGNLTDEAGAKFIGDLLVSLQNLKKRVG